MMEGAMIEYTKKILTGQFEASLAMLNQCVRECPAENWDDKIANFKFWQAAYHTLCCVDLYLSPSEAEFVYRDIHFPNSEDPFHPPEDCTFSQEQIGDYLAICRQKAVDTLAAETPESLLRESGFDWVPLTRGELHLYNIRHIQHHTGQLSAHLRRRGGGADWVGSGWRE